MTELQALYQKYRDAGCKHYEAVEKLALRLELDKATVRRTLTKAETADANEQRSARRRAEAVVRA